VARIYHGREEENGNIASNDIGNVSAIRRRGGGDDNAEKAIMKADENNLQHPSAMSGRNFPFTLKLLNLCLFSI
jgi:hypothetical protein